MSNGLDNFGTVRWQLACLLLLVWLIIFIVLIKGVSSLGKVGPRCPLHASSLGLVFHREQSVSWAELIFRTTFKTGLSQLSSAYALLKVEMEKKKKKKNKNRALDTHQARIRGVYQGDPVPPKPSESEPLPPKQLWLRTVIYAPIFRMCLPQTPPTHTHTHTFWIRPAHYVIYFSDWYVGFFIKGRNE